MPHEIERRTMNMDGLEVRAADSVAPKIVGHAALFDSFSSPIANEFVEVIRPGAFDRAVRENQDVRALINHDKNFVLGRTASGTLRLSVDSVGLGIEIDPPDTSFARDLAVSIGRGDISQMSFAFTVRDQKFTRGGGPGGLDLRELIDVDLWDVSAVTYPAYSDTAVEMNSQNTAVVGYRDWLSMINAEENDRAIAIRSRRQRQLEAGVF